MEATDVANMHSERREGYNQWNMLRGDFILKSHSLSLCTLNLSLFSMKSDLLLQSTLAREGRRHHRPLRCQPPPNTKNPTQNPPNLTSSFQIPNSFNQNTTLSTGSGQFETLNSNNSKTCPKSIKTQQSTLI